MGTATADPLLNALDRLERRLDRLDQKVDALGFLAHFGARTSQAAEAAGAAADLAWSTAEARGIDPIATGQRGVEIALRAADPASLDLVEKLLEPDNLALVSKLMARSDLLTLALDTADAALGELDARKVDVPALAKQGAGLAAELSGSLDFAGEAGTALIEARGEPAKPLGPFGLLGALLDADVQRAAGLGVAIARRLGKRLA